MTRALPLLAALVVSLAAPAAAQLEPPPGTLPPGALPVLSRSGRPELIVIRAQTDPTWSRGPIRLLSREAPTEVTRSAAVRTLPRELRRDLRGFVRMYRHGREVCRARLGRPFVFRHVTPLEELTTAHPEPGEPLLSRAEVAQLGWDNAERELLVAPAIPVRGDCAGAHWASRHTVVFGASASIDPATLTAFRALDDYAVLADGWRTSRHDDDDPDAERWDARSGGRYLRAMDFTGLTGRRFTLVSGEAHGGCGGFTGTLWALFEQTAEGPAIAFSAIRWEPVQGLADFDGDGMPELLGVQSILHLSEGELNLRAPYLGCPC